jgi:RHS repeat-associated protein
VSGQTTLNYTYDANGNVTNDGSHGYTYDSENRVISVDNGAAVYAYDHQNRRYKKTVGSTVTHYVWEGNQVVGEYNGSTGTMLVSYSYAGSRLIGKNAGSTQVILSDRISVRLALSNVGVVAGRQGQLPFGEDFAESGLQEKHHFTSYERDGETGTDYAVNRQYSNGLGRFMRSDPDTKSCDFNNPQSLDRYVYVRNDPINKADPLGLNECSAGQVWWEPPGGGIAVCLCTETYCEWDYRLRPISENEPKYQAPDGRPHPCPKYVRDWFKKYYAFFADMAKRLGVPVEYIIAVATAESGWHGYKHNNPFNSPPGHRYPSLEAAEDAWIARWGKDVNGGQTIEEFAQKLWEDHYDREDVNWRGDIATQYQYIVDHEYDCTAK